jgi:thiamine-monophosphate kinase
MKLSRIGELALLEKVRGTFEKRARGLVLGIGDDAAVLNPGPGLLLATTDMMLEDVHFDLRLVTPFQVGFKLVSVNVSDIYAMGGRPRFALLAVAAPSDAEGSFLDDFFAGVKEASAFYGLSVAGGDISSSSGGMAFSATVLGHAQRPLRRSGARPGDGIYVTGSLGASACGLALLKKMGRPVTFGRPLNRPLQWDVMEPLLRRHLMPVARRPQRFARAASAMIDLSDGLFMDLGRLCAESGVGARIYLGDLPVSRQTAAASAFLGLDPLGLAVSGGEDYELLFTARREVRGGARRIGEITQSGLFAVDESGKEKPVKPKGYEHFRG